MENMSDFPERHANENPSDVEVDSSFRFSQVAMCPSTQDPSGLKQAHFVFFS